MIQPIIAALIAVGIPAVFLFVIYTLDLYASRTFRLVLLCFGWGGVGGVALAYLINTYVALPIIRALGLSYILLYVAFAPVAEEFVKSLSLFYVARRPEFTYFVDGAIYGFAAGIGFSITENFLYISQNPRQSILLAVVRSFSTCLMHGTAAGLVGAAVGRFRFRRRSGRGLAMAAGWIAAMLLHAAFNSIAQIAAIPAALATVIAVVVGLAGVGLIAFFISAGLREERQWLAETLDAKMRVTGAEMRAAQSYANLNELLKPIAGQFPQQAEQVEALILLQAQLGLKRQVQQKIDDAKLKEQLAAEIAQGRSEMERLRKAVGPWVMTYVRTVFPEGSLDVWARLESLIVQSGPSDLQRWGRMLTGEVPAPSGRNIWAMTTGELRRRESEGP